MGLRQVSLHLVCCLLLVCCILFLLCLGMVLQFLIFPRLYHEGVLDFVKCFLSTLQDDHVNFVFEFVYTVDYVDGFLYIKPFLYPWDEAYLVMLDDWFFFFVCLFVLFCFVFVFVFL